MELTGEGTPPGGEPKVKEANAQPRTCHPTRRIRRDPKKQISTEMRYPELSGDLAGRGIVKDMLEKKKKGQKEALTARGKTSKRIGGEWGKREKTVPV